MSQKWIAQRTSLFDTSGIRKVFELGASLENPINLSIGQPDFDMPLAAQRAAVEAMESGKNGYALSQGIPALREKLLERVRGDYPRHDDRDLLVTSGTSGGIMLSMLAAVDPGDEVIVFDPCFVMYDALAKVVGGKAVLVDTYPDFHVDVNRVADAITPRTKMILFNTPNNPTGAVATRQEVKDLAELAASRDVMLVSDEIYREFCYEDFVSPAEFNPETVVLDGFSKTYGMPGWRVGYCHGPKALIQAMIKLQQYSFVCAPHPAQYAALAALDVTMEEQIAAYQKKRDMLIEALQSDYEIAHPGGSFYLFPKAPWGTGTEFVTKAITEHELLIIPGNVFSQRDTHFRISYAASDETIQRGISALQALAKG